MQELIVACVVILAMGVLGVRIWRFFTRAPACSCSGGADKDGCANGCSLRQGREPGKPMAR